MCAPIYKLSSNIRTMIAAKFIKTQCIHEDGLRERGAVILTCKDGMLKQASFGKNLKNPNLIIHFRPTHVKQQLHVRNLF